MGEMKKGHFTIGDPYNRSLKGEGTMWKPATVADLQKGSNKANEKLHLNVSVKLGSYDPKFVSETKEMFAGQYRLGP
jgi:hypothetical protein